MKFALATTFTTTTTLSVLALVAPTVAASAPQAALPRKLDKKGCKMMMRGKEDCGAPRTNKPTTKKPSVINKIPAKPTKKPSKRPTRFPTAPPTQRPTAAPTFDPTSSPTQRPTLRPTKFPTKFPTSRPTKLCPSVTATVQSHNGHLYALEKTTSQTWDQAKVSAEAHTCCGSKGHLVTIDDASERDFFEGSLLSGTSKYGWIGLNDKAVEGTYVWADGTSFDSSLFTVLSHSGDPADGADCVFYFNNDPSNKWRNTYCTNGIDFIVIEFDCST